MPPQLSGRSAASLLPENDNPGNGKILYFIFDRFLVISCGLVPAGTVSRPLLSDSFTHAHSLTQKGKGVSFHRARPESKSEFETPTRPHIIKSRTMISAA